jgi:hypothetical protein
MDVQEVADMTACAHAMGWPAVIVTLGLVALLWVIAWAARD